MSPTTDHFNKEEERRNLANEADRKATNVGIAFVVILAVILLCTLAAYIITS
jgi:hypothetical protein